MYYGSLCHGHEVSLADMSGILAAVINIAMLPLPLLSLVLYAKLFNIAGLLFNICYMRLFLSLINIELPGSGYLLFCKSGRGQIQNGERSACWIGLAYKNIWLQF